VATERASGGSRAAATPPDEVALAWDLGAGSSIEPDEDVDARAVRSAYAELRDRYYATS
jgi:hypothetical protein